MTNKELHKEMIRIAIPVFIGNLGFLLFDIIDIFWISSLGTDTVAGVASAGFLDWALGSFMGVTYVGCSSLISQAVGAKNQKMAFDVAREAIQLSLFIALFLMLLLFCVTPSLLLWMGLNPSAFQAGYNYFKVIILGLPIFYIFMLTGQIFYAHGDSKTAVGILSVALVLNAILDPFFIFGWGPFPKWGVSGASFATVLSFFLSLFLRFWFLRRKNYIDSLKTFFTFSTTYFYKILSIGIPTASARVIWSMVYPLLSTIITRFGMEPLAGVTVAHRVEGCAYFAAGGFSTAVSTLVGQNTGRRDFEMVKRIAYEGRFLITAVIIPLSLMFLLIPEFLVRFGANDPQVISFGASYLRIIGILELFLGWEMIFEGAFNGIGKTRPYMLISIPLTLGRYPLAYFFVNMCGFGVSSIWWAISISTGLKGLLLSLRFNRLMSKEHET